MKALPNVIFLVVMIGIFYFILIRPQKRKAEHHRALVMSIDEGDEVVMIGGEIGTIRAIREEEIDLEIAPGIRMRYLRGAIRDKFTLPEEEDEDVDVDDGSEA